MTPRERHIRAGVDRSVDIRVGRLEARKRRLFRNWWASSGDKPGDIRLRLTLECVIARLDAAGGGSGDSELSPARCAVRVRAGRSQR